MLRAVLLYRKDTYLHHGKVLGAVVGLEQGIARPALHKDAAERPEVNWMAPACRIVSL